MRGLVSCLLVGCLLVAPASSYARRLPSSGGEVRVFSGDRRPAALDQALTTVPLVEPAARDLTPTEAAAWPPVEGTSRRSLMIASARTTDEGTGWRLSPTSLAGDLTRAVSSCLDPNAGTWPSIALAASGIQATITEVGSNTSVLFSTPVGDLLTLLEGCYESGGAFVGEHGRWRARVDAAGGKPRLDGVRVVSAPTEADLLLSGDDETGQLLVTDWPDVWLLVPDAATRDGGAWALADGEARAAFQRDLAPELILAVTRAGRGSGADSLLPPGVAPSRPPVALTPSEPRKLTLTPLPDSAPRVRLTHDPSDALAADLAARLALLLRARGWAVAASDAKGATTRIIQWRPPVADPALALLLLGAELDLPIPTAMVEPLWSLDRAVRTAAALTLEQQWMNEGLVTPLLTAARAVFVSPALHGVRLRGDGTPVLSDAWWDRP